MLRTLLLAISFFLGLISLFGQTNTFPASGNVGIGTSSPIYKLDVLGTSAFRSTSYFYNSTAYAYESSTDQYFHFKTNQGKGYLGMNSSNSIILQANGGFVGIGTSVPTEKLSVNGKIKAHEINVTTTGWADYVFKPEYKLMPLSKLKAFIQKNGHLPDVSTEAQVMENGVNLAEMNVKLLEKVEELTLYAIEQHEEILGLKKELVKLNERIDRKYGNQ